MSLGKRLYPQLLILWAAGASAAPTLPATGVIDAARLGQSISRRTAPEARSLPAVHMPSSEASEIPEALTKIKFKLVEIILEGNTALPSADLLKLYKAKLNTDVSIVDLFNLREEITGAYREAGYVLVKVIIPEQNFDMKGAKVKIKIVEGYIGKIKIEGAASAKQKLKLEEYAKQVQKSKPLKNDVMERYALLSSDLKGLEVNYVLSPSIDELGAADLVINTKRSSKVDGQLQYDNFGSVLLGPEQITGVVTFNGLGGSLNELGLTGLVTANVNELQFGQISDRYPVGPYGTSLNLTALYTHTHPGGVLTEFEIFGASKELLFTVNHPVIRSRSKNFNAFVIGDGLSNESRTEFLNATFFKDEIRSLRAGLEYDENRWNGMNIITGTVSQGLPILGAREEPNSSAPLSRPDGHAIYTKLFGEASRLQFTDSAFSALVSVRGQFGFQPLLSAEQFGFGGALYGRGFDTSEILGDHGVDVKNEIRYDAKPAWAIMPAIQWYTFYDYGAVWNIDTEHFKSVVSAASLGGGFRTTLAKHVDIDLYAALPVQRGIATREFSREVRYVMSIVARG